MGLFDDYNFDPQQFAGGGLLGRLLSLQEQQGQYQPSQGFDVPAAQPVAAKPPQQFPSAESSTPLAPAQQAAGPTAYIPIGNYLMPQFGGPGVSQPEQPTHGLGDRLNAGFQSWAHTPVGNPFAGLANGIAGFSSGQPVSKATAQNSTPRNDASQRRVSDAPPIPQMPVWPVQPTLGGGRVSSRPNIANFGRSFRYGG